MEREVLLPIKSWGRLGRQSSSRLRHSSQKSSRIYATAPSRYFLELFLVHPSPLSSTTLRYASNLRKCGLTAAVAHLDRMQTLVLFVTQSVYRLVPTSSGISGKSELSWFNTSSTTHHHSPKPYLLSDSWNSLFCVSERLCALFFQQVLPTRNTQGIYQSYNWKLTHSSLVVYSVTIRKFSLWHQEYADCKSCSKSIVQAACLPASD